MGHKAGTTRTSCTPIKRQASGLTWLAFENFASAESLSDTRKILESLRIVEVN